MMCKGQYYIIHVYDNIMSRPMLHYIRQYYSKGNTTKHQFYGSSCCPMIFIYSFLNNVIIAKTKVSLPQTYVTYDFSIINRTILINREPIVTCMVSSED